MAVLKGVGTTASIFILPVPSDAIGSVHPSKSGTIPAFQGEKGQSQLDEKGNVFNTFNLFQQA